MKVPHSLYEESVAEKVGVYRLPFLTPILERCFGKCFYSFVVCDSLNEFHNWIVSQKPRVVIFASDMLKTHGSKKDLVQKTKKTLKELGIPSLILTQSMEEVKEWNRIGWPCIHFYHGPVDGHMMKKRIMDILAAGAFQERQISDILGAIFETGEMKPESGRGRSFRANVPNLFVALVQREIDMASRTGEKFSVMRICLGKLDEIEKVYGPIFARELELNLVLYIQERIRSSDLMIKGKRGELFLLLTRLPRGLALLVGERLRHSFIREASFQDGVSERFRPGFEYEVYSCPEDFSDCEGLTGLIGDVVKAKTGAALNIKP